MWRQVFSASLRHGSSTVCKRIIQFNSNALSSCVALSPFPSRYTTRCAFSAGSSLPKAEQQALSKIRNIGIIAHVDAGKTTLTERMLYYSGAIKSIGEVHDGDATMDHLKAEQERGITITSAAIYFDWKGHRFNLIDTPGHVDFTIEVERSVSVLDGAVTVLDAVAGVQAQTETVWKQSQRFGVPKIVFVNKMDRPGADYAQTVEQISSRFDVQALCLHQPVIDPSTRTYEGCVDVVRMESIMNSGSRGEVEHREPVKEGSSEYTLAVDGRAELADALSLVDDTFTEAMLEYDMDPLLVPNTEFYDALRRSTRSLQGVVVTCGSALRNQSVQPVMDSVIQFLPSPLECINTPRVGTGVKNALAVRTGRTDLATLPSSEIAPARQAPLVALAFKVSHRPHLGSMVFVRVYSGVLKSKSTLRNVTRGGEKERALRVVQLRADDFDDVDELRPGDIGAVLGLKHTSTSDSLSSWSLSNDKAPFVLSSITVPQPVFFCSIEPDTQQDRDALDEALAQLAREDPSLQVREDADTGQTVLAGMGELHLEVLGDRLKTEMKVNCELGKIRIAYQESVSAAGSVADVYTGHAGPNSGDFELDLTLKPRERRSGNRITLGNDVKKGSIDPIDIEDCVAAALSRGSLLGETVTDVEVTVRKVAIAKAPAKPELLAPLMRSAVSRAVQDLLGNEPILLEPYMSVELVTPGDYVGPLVSDLTGSRRAEVQSIEATANGTESVVHALVPLSQLLGYARHVRTVSQGNASLSMELDGYRDMAPTSADDVIQQLRGF